MSQDNAPQIVIEDNIAKINIIAEDYELGTHKKRYIAEKRKQVVLKGFRKGTAPESMVALLFKEEADKSARDNVVYAKYMKLLNDHKLRALSNPRVEYLNDGNGKIIADIVVDVLQPVILGQYLCLEIEKFPLVSIDAALKNTLAEIKQSYPKLIDTQDSIIVDKNVVIIDFVITDAGKEVERQIDFRVNIGDGLYYKLFEEQLLGMRAGDSKEFDITFPDTYHNEAFKNKLMHFNISVKAIKCISEYTDDELVKILSYENYEKMIESITSQIDNKFKNDEHLFYEKQILEELLSSHQFKIPNRLLDEEMSKIKVEHPEMNAEDVSDMADRFVRTDLVLSSIYERHPEIQLSQEQFNAKVTELALRAHDSIENVINKLKDAGKLQSYMNYLTNCQVINFLIEMSTKIEEKENG